MSRRKLATANGRGVAGNRFSQSTTTTVSAKLPTPITRNGATQAAVMITNTATPGGCHSRRTPRHLSSVHSQAAAAASGSNPTGPLANMAKATAA